MSRPRARREDGPPPGMPEHLYNFRAEEWRRVELWADDPHCGAEGWWWTCAMREWQDARQAWAEERGMTEQDLPSAYSDWESRRNRERHR
ncbi:hypothetical protein ABT269_05545 [Streptomyces viridosporus]|uniref:hypothetical protein n=1 Tax=Streptomyces viridosporus TaxID=67581 RepID=UPI003332EAD3